MREKKTAIILKERKKERKKERIGKNKKRIGKKERKNWKMKE